MKHKTSFLWCLPQNLLGFAVLLLTKARPHGDHFYYKFNGGSVSLGEFIFLSPSDWGDERVLNHERGHREQSRRLGWLYLPIVGIPSVIWQTCFRDYRKRYGIDYYSFFTERWADRLGGVTGGDKK